jgi:hypothetical protein
MDRYITKKMKNKTMEKAAEGIFCKKCYTWVYEFRPHEWWCPTLEDKVLIRNTADKLKDLLNLFNEHFR